MIIHHEQVRFVQGIQGWFSHVKINVTYYINRIKSPNHISIDTEKALGSKIYFHDKKKKKEKNWDISPRASADDQ